MLNTSALRTMINKGWTIANRKQIVSQIGKTKFNEISQLAQKASLNADVFEYSNAAKYLTPQNIDKTKDFLLNNIKEQNVLYEKLKPIFENLKGKNRKDFIVSAYDKMVEFMGLKGIAPKEITIVNKKYMAGNFDSLNNTIKCSEHINYSENDILNFIAHELTHCKQSATMLRTEGIGVKGYANALAENYVRECEKTGTGLFKSDASDCYVISVSSYYQAAKRNGRGESFLEALIEEQTRKYMSIIEQSYTDVLKLPKIKADSPEGIEAFKYLEAQRFYKQPLMFIATKAYRYNPLELEAYKFGDLIEKLYRIFNQYSTC